MLNKTSAVHLTLGCSSFRFFSWAISCFIVVWFVGHFCVCVCVCVFVYLRWLFSITAPVKGRTFSLTVSHHVWSKTVRSSPIFRGQPQSWIRTRQTLRLALRGCSSRMRPVRVSNPYPTTPPHIGCKAETVAEKTCYVMLIHPGESTYILWFFLVNTILKVVHKSCGFCACFQLFGGRLFKCGF